MHRYFGPFPDSFHEIAGKNASTAVGVIHSTGQPTKPFHLVTRREIRPADRERCPQNHEVRSQGPPHGRKVAGGRVVRGGVGRYPRTSVDASSARRSRGATWALADVLRSFIPRRKYEHVYGRLRCSARNHNWKLTSLSHLLDDDTFPTVVHPFRSLKEFGLLAP